MLGLSSFRQACREGGYSIERWLRTFDAHFGRMLYAEAAHVLHDWHRAEDIVQDAMIKVWQRCDSFRGEGHPVAWVRQIVRRTLLDALRAAPPEEPLQQEDGTLTSNAATAVAALSERIPRPEDLRDKRMAQAAYQQGWARFAQAHPEHAAVLRWVVEDGMELTDLAALLGRTSGATREYVSQCRKKARPFLEEWRSLVSPHVPKQPPQKSEP